MDRTPSRNRKRKTTPPTELVGNVFVILSGAGLFWDGQGGWVKDWRAALHFADGAVFDPWLDCYRACRTVAARTGLRCVPAFFAAPEVRVRQP